MQTKIKLAAGTLLVAFLATGCAPNPAMQGTTSDYGTGATSTTTGGYQQPSQGSDGYNTTNQNNGYGNNTGSYDTSSNSNSGNNGYYDYTNGSSSSSNGGYGNNSGSYDYGSSNSGYGSSSGSASGSQAIQVIASGSRSTAESMQRQMQSQGFNAVIDSVGGMYKVRIPYTSRNDAQANLSRVRSSVPDAFITTR